MFDALKVKNEIVQWIREYFRDCGGADKAVIGISGGKDSSVVAALCAEALGKENTIGVLMPCGEQADISASYHLVEHLSIPYYVINIKPQLDGVYAGAEDKFELSEEALRSLQPRLRMCTVYAVAQSHNGRVANTSNLSEDWVGYFTRWGDGCGDFSPVGRLTVAEVKAVGRVLGLPEDLIEKVPIDGICGKTDEDNLGFTYAALDRYIREGVCEDETVKARIDRMHALCQYKLKPIPAYELK